jgi:nitrogen regulatory protein P-II 1
MKLITAFIQPERLSEVKQSLYKEEIYKMTVSTVMGCGQQKGFHEQYRGIDIEVNLIKKIRIDIAINDDYVDKTVQAIIQGAKTGHIGDGKIFVTELSKCIRIRTEEEGEDAIG